MVAVEGTVELIETVEIPVGRVQGQVTGPGAGGGVDIAQGMGAQVAILSQGEAADDVLLEAGDQQLQLPVLPRQPGHRVGGHQPVDALVGCQHPAPVIHGRHADVVEGVGGGKEEAPRPIRAGVGGAARERGRGGRPEPAIRGDGVAQHPKVGAYSGIEPAPVRADDQGLHLAAGLDFLQRDQLALFQSKHMDQPAHRVGDINDLLHCDLLHALALIIG
ncbi:hypothetical protein D3C86_1395180 [compost metagenome]